MNLEIENARTISTVSEVNLRTALTKLKSYGPSSFACLTSETGAYIQVAGGGVTCVVEFKCPNTSQLYRAYHDAPSTPFDDGTKLVFGGGEVVLLHDEWFSIGQVIDLFLEFRRDNCRPGSVFWRVTNFKANG